jgi:hypothetical protein
VEVAPNIEIRRAGGKLGVAQQRLLRDTLAGLSDRRQHGVSDYARD